MSVVHEYTLIVQWSEEDQLYLAYSPELPGMMTHGRTYVEAAEMGVEVMELWCDATQAAEQPLPPPLHYRAEGGASLRQVAERLAAGEAATALAAASSHKHEGVIIGGTPDPKTTETGVHARKPF